MNYLFIGIGISLLSLIVSLITKDWSLLYKVTGILGLVCIVIGAILSGAFISSDQMARNLNSESREDRKARISFTSKLVLIGTPNIVVAIVVYFLIR